MFFLYLVIFVVIVSTPFIIYDGFWIFTEDETEALLLLFSGVISFLIYRFRDYQVFQNIKDRIRLQRLFARAQRDLSESYSYIGQANRRADIMYEIFSDLSHVTSDDYSNSIRDALDFLPHAKEYSFRLIDLNTMSNVAKIDNSQELQRLPDKLFCKSGNTHTYQYKDILFIYSEVPDKKMRSCLAVPFSEKAEDDTEFFKALTAYFIMIYVLHQNTCVKNVTEV
jgi:hypothetical protein